MEDARVELTFAEKPDFKLCSRTTLVLISHLPGGSTPGENTTDLAKSPVSFAGQVCTSVSFSMDPATLFRRAYVSPAFAIFRLKERYDIPLLSATRNMFIQRTVELKWATEIQAAQGVHESGPILKCFPHVHPM